MMGKSLQLLQEQLAAHVQLHRIARQEVEHTKEAHTHEGEYGKKETAEAMLSLQRELCQANLQSEQLKLEVLRWRKQCSLMRLKLASSRENAQLHEHNIELVSEREQRLSQEVVALKSQLAAAVQQLTDMTAAKAQAQAECAKYQGQALQADMQLTKLNEEYKLSSGRCNTAAAQVAELQQQLAAVTADNASLQRQLDESHGCAAMSAAAQEQLQQSLESLQRDLRSCEERLAVQQKAAAAAEAAEAKATAAAEAAKDALAVKEQQLAEWRQLEQASKETASQQLQLSQARLEGAQEKATATEARLLDELATLRQQLAHEKAARATAEAGSSIAGQAAAANKVLEAQLEELNKQVSTLKSQVAAAERIANQESKRAAALEQELEQQQECNTLAAVQAVGDIVQQLDSADKATQGGSSKAAAAAAAAAAGRPRRSSAGGRQARLKGQTLPGREAAQGDIDEAGSEDDGQAEEPSSRNNAASKARKRPASASKGKTAEKQRELQPMVEKGGSDEKEQAAPNARSRVLQQMNDNQQRGELQQDRRAPAARAAAGKAGGIGGKAAPGTSAAAEAAPSTVHQEEEDVVGQLPSLPPLSFVPQSTVTPTAALQRPGVLAAAQARVSATDMLKKLSSGVGGVPGKPGARKRKFVPLTAAAGAVSMDVIPASLLVKPTFQAPKVRKPGA